jgi:predicted alpha/beta-hydrolase family hydrolase
LQISVDIAQGQSTTALIYPAQIKTRLPATLILAHGAGAPQLHPFMVSFARAFSERGLDVVTFNFLYAEQRRKVPDRMPQLITCYRAVIEAARAELPSARERLFIGGKSMGGRAATHVAAGRRGARSCGPRAARYPLHPPGAP